MYMSPPPFWALPRYRRLDHHRFQSAGLHCHGTHKYTVQLCTSGRRDGESPEPGFVTTHVGIDYKFTISNFRKPSIF